MSNQEQVEKTVQEILERRGQKCTECGNLMGDAAKFCNKCGGALSPTKVLYKDDDDGVCGEFGHLIQLAVIGARFCCGCGCELIALD